MPYTNAEARRGWDEQKGGEPGLMTLPGALSPLWTQSLPGYVVLLLFQTGARNWSINSLTPSALHDVIMWNTDKQKS